MNEFVVVSDLDISGVGAHSEPGVDRTGVHTLNRPFLLDERLANDGFNLSRGQLPLYGKGWIINGLLSK
jgi:hypothetical protein